MTAAGVQPDLRVAVLGVGAMGAYHVAGLSQRTSGAAVTVVNDFSTERAEHVAATVPGCRVVADPFDAIRAEDVDAVVIATPGLAHQAQVQAGLERGIPVLCEKPLTVAVDTAYALVEQEAALGRQLVQVGFMRRFDTEYAALRRLISTGGLGNPLMIHCTHRNLDVPPHFDSEMMIRDSVVHEVDAARFLLDEEIVAVQVVRGSATTRAPAGTSDPMLVIFETESGRVVTDEIFVRTGVGYEVRTEVVGEEGSATIGLDTGLVRTTTDGRRGGSVPPGFLERFGAAYDTELQRFVAAARRGAIDGPGVWDGYAAVAVCEAAVAALRSGDRVKVELEPRPAGVRP
jgi:myo-inositol 2-dehydrogenase/D-chiro-inositol 1-dehydrogenase